MSSGQPIRHHIFSRFCLVVSDKGVVPDDKISYFSVDNVLSYVGFCDDFGPMSLGSVFQFCKIVDSKLTESQPRPVAMISRPESRTLTNAVFLIGTYMIMKLNMALNEIEHSFEDLSYSLVSYRDVSSGPQNFSLFVKDCWEGLHRAKGLGWVDFGPDGFDIEEYNHYDDSLNADLHEVVPGKFVAMRGPKDLPGDATFLDMRTRRSGQFSHREFSPAHYVDILRQFDVKLVVRLNTAEYSSETFIEHGIAVADLHFEDCTSPPIDVVAKFMMLAEGVRGSIAVHCKAGLGRTGTLIALYMMKHYGFTARGAMGWIRIVRPGSIIGTQQQFLCDKEELMHRSFARFLRGGPAVVPSDTSIEGLSRFVERVRVLVDSGIRKALHRSPGQQLSMGVRTSTKMRWGASEKNLLAEHVSRAADRRNGQRALDKLYVSNLRAQSL